MLHIYICDDNKYQLKIYKKIILDIISKHEISREVEIICATTDPTIILDYLRGDAKWELYFIDVDFGPIQMNGIELGINIRARNPNANIVIITAYENFAFDTYKHKINVKDYILKSDIKDLSNRIESCILDIYSTTVEMSENNTKSQNENVLILNDLKILADKIYFIKVDPNSKRRLLIYGENVFTQLHFTLREIRPKLGEMFFQCHKSYIVNIKYIKRIDHKKRIVYMVDDNEIIVSYRHIRELKRLYGIYN